MGKKIPIVQVINGVRHVGYLDVEEDRRDLEDLMKRRDSRRVDINRSSPPITVYIK